jgi:exopolyphosphatase/guanosine-5'-triphosphate,3'-diphosphate pyrophosphatase
VVKAANAERAPVAVIDIGSNSVLLLVLAADSRVLSDEARVTRLGAGVFASGSLDPAAVERTLAAIRELSPTARGLGATPVVAVGTEALRRARDASAFLERLRDEGLVDTARVLDPEEEAELSLEASRRERPRGAVCVVDVGGGSTEVCWVDSGGSSLGLSLPVGSVRLTERHIRSDPPEPAQLARVREEVAAETGSLPAGLARSCEVVAVAGTATTLAALELELARYDGSRVEGLALGRERLRAWIERLARLTTPERRALPGMDPGRADVIVAGLLALEGTLVALGARRFRVSERGVRHGVAIRLLAGADPV